MRRRQCDDDVGADDSRADDYHGGCVLCRELLGRVRVHGACDRGEFPITFTVGADGAIQGTGTVPDGSTFEITGTLGTGDSLSAGGDVTGAGMRITFDGSVKVEDGNVTVEGAWQGGTNYSGIWTAGKDVK